MPTQKGAYVLFISWRGGVALVYGFAKNCALGFKPLFARGFAWLSCFELAKARRFGAF